MSIVIREYQESDRPELVRCITALQDEMAVIDILYRARRGTEFNGERYIELLLEEVRKHAGKIFFAEDEGRVVGCVAGALIEKTEKDLLEGYPSKQGRIDELYVDSTHRGQKVGLQLVKTMEGYFKELGCEGCLVSCFAPNRIAHEFYEKLGYSDRNIDLRKSL